MPAQEQNDEERTETATAYRREEFRRQGTVAMSREVTAVLLLLGVGAGMYGVCHSSVAEFSLLGQKFFRFEELKDLGKSDVMKLLVSAVGSLGSMVWPVLVVAMVMGTIACVAQVGFYMTWEPVVPNFDRINPVNGFQRLFFRSGARGGVQGVD